MVNFEEFYKKKTWKTKNRGRKEKNRRVELSINEIRKKRSEE